VLNELAHASLALLVTLKSISQSNKLAPKPVKVVSESTVIHVIW